MGIHGDKPVVGVVPSVAVRLTVSERRMTECHYLHEGRCILGLHGGAPSPGVCFSCDRYAGPMRGLGDMIDAATTALRLKQLVGDCGGCAKRRAALNRLIPLTDEPRGET